MSYSATISVLALLASRLPSIFTSVKLLLWYDLDCDLVLGMNSHPSVQIHVRYEDNMMTMCCLGRPSGHPADGTMYTMLTGQPDNIK